jgi:membrane associated rhomboid family serine protease
VILTMESQRVGNSFVAAYDEFYAYQYGFIPAYHKFSWLNYITCTFLHAGFLHILGNMLFLFFAGLAVEDAWGRCFFSVFYLLSGFVATATFAYSAPNSRIYLVGASGAMAGVMGAFMVRYFKARIKLFYFVIFRAGTFKAPAYIMLPLWIAFELKDTFFASGVEEGGVAFWAHIGGFFFGAVVGALVHFTGVGKLLAPKNVGRASSFGTGNAIHEAVAHLQEGEHDEAIRKLKQRLDAVPNDEKACLALAKVYGEIGLRTAEIAAYVRLIHVLMQKNRLNDALQAYVAVTETYRADEPPLRLPARDWLLLCDHLLSRDMLREAVGEYEKLGLAYPGEPVANEALVRAAELRLQLGEYEYAANIYAFVKTQPLSDPNLHMRIAEGEAQMTNLLRGKNAA